MRADVARLDVLALADVPRHSWATWVFTRIDGIILIT